MLLAKKVMMDRIRQGLGISNGANDGHRQLATRQWLSRRAHAEPQELFADDQEKNLDMFVRHAMQAGAHVLAETNLENIPQLISQFINEKNLPKELVIMDPALLFLKNIMDAEQDIKVINDLVTKPATAHQVVSLTLGLAAIAESGSVMVVGNALSPSRLYFLPLAHVVMLSCQQLVARYEDALQFIDHTNMPRAVHLITGPSRTADIDQTIEQGMHGPKELLIILTP